MFPNPIAGQSYFSRGIHPDENESMQPDLSLTLTVVVLCITGPFWLMYRLLEFLAKKSVLFTSQALQKMFSRA